VLWDSIYHGETADGRLLRPGWAEHGFQENASMRRGVDEMPSPGGELTLTPINPVRPGPGNLHVKVRREHALQPPNVIGAPEILPDGYLHAVNVSSPIRSVYVFDLGQNFAGWVRNFMEGSAGLPVILRYAEALLPFLLTNLCTCCRPFSQEPHRPTPMCSGASRRENGTNHRRPTMASDT
jgi:hypothetical protein